MKNILIACCILLCAATLVSQPTPAVASSLAEPQMAGLVQSAQNAPDCYSLDLVFIIDQSLSMGRAGNPNDPLKQRSNAPRYALDWLANNRLSRLALCPDAVHRIGVISFGSEAQIDLDFTEIDPVTQTDWDEMLRGLEEKIQPRTMGGTNPAKAFKLANDMLTQAGPLGPLPRKRAIILLTDGQPCITEECNDPSDFYETYMRELMNQVSRDFPFSEAVKKRDDAVRESIRVYGTLNQIPDETRNKIRVNYPVSNEEWFNSIYLWVVAMNDVRPYLTEVGEQFESMATEHNGDLIDLTTQGGAAVLAIPNVFNQIMSSLAELNPTLLGCGNLAVNPYLSGVVLDIYKAADGLEVEVNYGDKSLKNGEGDKEFFGLEQYHPYGAVEHYRFRNPPAGVWKIVCSDPNGAEVSYLPFDAQIKMVQPNGVLPHYDVGDALYDPVPSHQFHLKYRVIDQSSSQPLNLDPNYPLDMQAVVTSPDGSQMNLGFEFEQNGVWTSQSPLPANQLGSYAVSVSGEADCVADPERPESCPIPTVVVIPSMQGTYNVEEISLFHIQVVQPVNNQNVPIHSSLMPDWLAVQPVMVEVELVDLDGQALPTGQVLAGDAAMVLKAALTHAGTETEVNLIPDPTLPSRFTAEFDSPPVSGEYTLTVAMPVDAYRFEEYRPLENPVVIHFTRRDPWPNNPLFYRMLCALLIMIITGLIVHAIWLRTFPILGSLVFVKRDENGEKNVPLNIARRKRQIVLKGKSIPSDLRADFKRIDAKNQLGQGRPPSTRTKIRLGLDGSPTNMVDGQSLVKRGWQITYAWGQISKQKDRFVLWAAVAILISIVMIVGIFVV